MKKLCAVFPGRRYSCDRSLLHFSSRVIAERGYEMVYLHYDLPKEKKDLRDLLTCGNDCYNKAIEELQSVDFSQYDRILFLSKSMGTMVSGRLIKERNLTNVHQILLTPVEDALPFIEPEDLLITSDKDKYLVDAKSKLANYNNAYFFPGYPHSFEFPDNYSLTFRALYNVVAIVEKYVDTIDK